MSAYIEFVEAFNHSLKILVKDLAARHPTDATIHRAYKRMMTVISFEPLFVINSVGPYLYSYRTEIYSLESDDVETFFLENDFDTELKRSINQEKAELVKYIIPKAKECARSLNPI